MIHIVSKFKKCSAGDKVKPDQVHSMLLHGSDTGYVWQSSWIRVVWRLPSVTPFERWLSLDQSKFVGVGSPSSRL
jgi:hypothetical protein